MARSCCLAGIDGTKVAMFSAILKTAGFPALATLAALDVRELGSVNPDVLVCDVDAAAVDKLELLRRIRFVIPDCLIAVYTGSTERTWGLACHLAGANCLLSKASNERQLTKAVIGAMRTGCYTDPRFAA